jgi:phage terminase large subunit-like protein
VQAYVDFNADVIVVEKNFGGAMAEQVVRTAARAMGVVVKIVMVNASRGKAIRAQPIAALYEQDLMHHCEVFPELEDQLVTWTPESGRSPDRLDALVWTFTNVMLKMSTELVVPWGDERPSAWGSDEQP